MRAQRREQPHGEDLPRLARIGEQHLLHGERLVPRHVAPQRRAVGRLGPQWRGGGIRGVGSCGGVEMVGARQTLADLDSAVRRQVDQHAGGLTVLGGFVLPVGYAVLVRDLYPRRGRAVPRGEFLDGLRLKRHKGLRVVEVAGVFGLEQVRRDGAGVALTREDR